jgi:16S rRNA (uracil1498-N3)-methyltransferase
MSRSPRFFISPDRITGSSISITGEDARHIAAALRMKTGDSLALCDGQGMEYAARITRLDRSEIITEIMEQTRHDLRSPRIILAQGLPKSDKMDLIVQKATELGAASIVPVITERTILKIRDEEARITRWRKIAREAAMQSSRFDIPRVERIQKYPDFLKGLTDSADDLFLLPWEEGTGPLKNILRSGSGAKSILVLIGPEGGFSANEAGMAIEKGFHPVSLGRTILRTETAAIAALSMIGYEFS